MPGLPDAFRNGTVDYTWSTVESGFGEHFGRFRVFTDAAKVGGTRLSCSAREAQECADLLGAILPTCRLLDLRHRQAKVNLDPHPLPNCPTSMAGVRRHSGMIDQQADGRAGIVSPCGKHWVLHHGMSRRRAVNYGWHIIGALRGTTWRGIPTYPSVTDSDLRVLQGPGLAHGHLHHDYSQTLILVHGQCEIDGQRMRTASVLTDPELCGLLVASGRPLSGPRLPGVPQAPMGVPGAVEAAGAALGGAAGTVAGALEDSHG